MTEPVRRRLPTSLDALPVVMIDGGLSTQLEQHGQHLDSPLWTARTLLDAPEVVRLAHREFVQAGADVITSASYQVSRGGFEAVGLSARDADRVLARSVEVARAAVQGTSALVAASVGPFGAISNDGGEYRGRYGRSIDELASFHAERLPLLIDAGPDLLAIETIPDADEARALVQVLTDAVPVWVSFTAADEGHLRAGQPIEDAVTAVLSHPAVVAIGVNCTEPAAVPGLVARIRAVSDLPVIAYPNAGGTWDASTSSWHAPGQPVADAVLSWVASGARIVGGCCGTTASHIAQMRRALSASHS